MKIATWNVNSIRARVERFLAWLQRTQPDIVCLQELKAREDAFPYDAIREAGYHAAVYGQRTFNGVGILSRIEPQNVRPGMNDGVEDPQARFITAQVGEIQILSAYVPNGQMVGSAQYAYKLNWLGRLRTFLEKHFTPTTPVVICGDFNVARDERDVADPAARSARCASTGQTAADGTVAPLGGGTARLVPAAARSRPAGVEPLPRTDPSGPVAGVSARRKSLRCRQR